MVSEIITGVHVLNQVIHVDKSAKIIQVIEAGVKSYHNAIEQIQDSYIQNTSSHLAANKVSTTKILNIKGLRRANI